MALADISFANKQATGQEELTGAQGVSVNVMVDQTGAIRRRPGIEAAPALYSGVFDTHGICGVYTTVSGITFAFGNVSGHRPVYIVQSGSVVAIGSGVSDATVGGTGRLTFAETQLLLVIAGAGPMQKIVLGAGATSVSSLLGGEPPVASHVAANSSRLLGNIATVSSTVNFDKSVVRFSDIANGNTSYAGMEQWTEGTGTAGHFSAEANPDPVVALYENTNEVFCFGTTSLQVFDPDPTAVWAPAVTKELGIAAPYSVVKVNQEFAWLDNYRRVVISDARSQSVISDPIKKTLDDIETVDDCYGYRVVTGPLDAMVWSFPSDGRTFAFQQGGGWSEWLGWDQTVNNWAPFQVLSHHFSPTSHDNIVGTASGRVGRLSLDATTDFGTPINARVETGYLARGTDQRKHCKCVRVALRRGQTSASTGPVALLSWRDQPGEYGAPLAIDLGATGDTEIVLEFRSLGVYRRRQWRFEFSGTDDLSLVSVTEEYEVLSN